MPASDHQRILIVDDTLSIHRDFARILGSQPTDDSIDELEALLLSDPRKPAAEATPATTFELSFASQGQQALALVSAGLAAGTRFALAFVDMRMPPGWNGLETIEQLWNADPDLQVVICSAYSDHSWKDIREQLGRRGGLWQNGLLILKKPFDTIEVLQSAHALTEKWRLGQESRTRLSDLEAAVQVRTEQLARTNERLAEELRKQEAARGELERLTVELGRRNVALRFVLDNVDQGLFTVDLDGKIASERSVAVTRLLGPLPSDGTLPSYVAQFAPAWGAWFDVSWATLREHLLPVDLALDQLPRYFEVSGRHLEITYKAVESAASQQIVVVVTDVTARVGREHAERDHRELGTLAVRIVTDRQGFNDFQAEIQHYLDTIIEGAHGDPRLLRIPVHTVKGMAGLFGLTSIAELCHDIEEAIEDQADPGPLVAQLVARWWHLGKELSPMTSARSDWLEIDAEDISDLLEGLRRLSDGTPLIRIVESWRHQRARGKLERLAEQARALSTQLGKDHLVEIDCERTRLPPLGSKFWSSLVHVIRNAIDHGIEAPEARAAAGKALEPTLTLRAADEDDGFVIEIADHGRGIDWTQLAEAARAAGIPADTHDQLVDALFRDGVTTRTVVSATSGRGIGLAAVRDACTEIGGQVAVSSEPGRGTTFRFTFPEPALLAQLPVRSRTDSLLPRRAMS
jgi:two-component system chemotaxis sensor kinase CheA